jgi:hypothetical protein
LEEPFILEVEHHGRQLQLETRLLRLGYIWKFAVIVDEIEILFERDEEGGIRAVVPEGVDEKNRRQIDPSLLHSIAETIQAGIA